MKRVAVVFGTRPDAIKMAPILLQQTAFPDLELIAVSSGQHKEMLTPVLSLFGITPAFDAAIMDHNQSLDSLTARAITGLGAIFDEVKPDYVLAHGDTTTGFAASLAAFYRGIPVGHVEAGLRTPTLNNPFPEEMNRRVIDQLATFHFAPTSWAADNLTREGFSSVVTGNTVIDALQFVRSQQPALPASLQELAENHRVILLTTHRRENIGEGMEHIFQAVKQIAEENPDVSIVFPIHLNAAVRTIATAVLSNLPQVHIIEPLAYPELVALLERCYLVMTDSGGIQEEAPAFAKPVVVLRETTERPEVISAGCGKLVGSNRELIYSTVSELLHNPTAYQAMAGAQNPYGEPGAAVRILQEISAHD
jgi:UDP-N-acetylglucosamine 2-epimerase (non-hydrolysing)